MTEPDPRPDARYATSSRPVNSRTASRQLLQASPVNPVVLERLEAAKARTRLGPALAEQIRSQAQPLTHTRVSPLAVAGGMLATACAVAVFVAWLQNSLWLAIAGVLGLLCGLAVAWRGMQSPAAAPVPVAALFDASYLETLDEALAKVALEVPDSVAADLTALKQLIVRIARHGAATDENFTLDDRMYLTECVRRYLPDTLQSYLAVAAGQRDMPLVEGHTATQLLSSQLALLHAQLQKREAALGRSAAETLLRQQRFLQSKASK
jgi:hypothetical protein